MSKDEGSAYVWKSRPTAATGITTGERPVLALLLFFSLLVRMNMKKIATI